MITQEQLLYANGLLKQQLEKLQAEFNQYKRESVKWCADDVYWTAKEMQYNCSSKKAQKLLEEIIHNHDAEMGICWDTIRTYIQDNCKKKKS